jgi:hypothetical protein
MSASASPLRIDHHYPQFTTNERNYYSKQRDKALYNSPEEEYDAGKLELKRCTKCQVDKANTIKHFAGNTSGTDGFMAPKKGGKKGVRRLRPECKECGSEVAAGKKVAMAFAKKNDIPYKAPSNAVCAICGGGRKDGDGLVWDHDHEQNIFRGYCHNSCNRSIGVLGDDVTGLITALNYLLKTEPHKIVQNKDGALTLS